MSKPGGYGPNRDLEDALQGALDSIARFLVYAGGLATIVSVGFLIYTFIVFSGPSQASEAQAASNIEIFRKILMAGIAALGVGTTYTFWGEETLGVLQLIVAAILYLAPLFVPSLVSGGNVAPVGARALSALQVGGLILGMIAVCVLIVDATLRVRDRAQQGARADQLKYGKGLKEEKDIQNVFLGKCWQLPYCRKFVRERCPIYHSRRTCWRERVGCMCEEEVIRNAMENKPIPKDMVAAARFIPYNNRIPLEQKKERCRQCVIYNEHQKHKYRAVMPLTVLAFGGFYALFRPQLLEATGALVQKIDAIVGTATFRPDGTQRPGTFASGIFQEMLLVCFIIIALTYAMKVIEFLIFKLKV